LSKRVDENEASTDVSHYFRQLSSLKMFQKKQKKKSFILYLHSVKTIDKSNVAEILNFKSSW
jgi:hypothetical protein